MKDVIYGLSNDDYHNSPPYSDFVSSTDLKLYLRSPKHYKYMQEHPQPQTDAQRFGSLFHDLMASLAECNGDYDKGFNAWDENIAIFDPPINPKTEQPYGATTKAYQEAYQQFLADNKDKTIASREDCALAIDMTFSLHYNCGSTSEQVRKLLKWAKATEVSYFYKTEDGIKLKVRPDMLTSNKLVDWKTCALDSLDEDSIAKQIIRYRYDVSLSMYQFVLHEMTGKWYAPYLVFVCKNPPFECMIADVSEWCYTYNKQFDLVNMGVGAQEFRRLLDLHTQCVKSGEWKGAESLLPEENRAIMKPRIPAYFNRLYEE